MPLSRTPHMCWRSSVIRFDEGKSAHNKPWDYGQGFSSIANSAKEQFEQMPVINSSLK